MLKKILVLCLLMTLPFCVFAEANHDLSGLGLDELEALRNEADAQIKLRQLPDENGYLDVLDGEAYARMPAEHRDNKVRLTGEIVSVLLSSRGTFHYAISLMSNPGLIFLADYDQPDEDPWFLSGDTVTVYGVFDGISAFDEVGSLTSGVPSVTADLVVHAQIRAEQTRGTRETPLAVNETAVYEGSYWSDYASFEFEITGMKRGYEASKLVKDMSKYNITPLKTQEYFVVWLRVKAVSAPNGRAPLSQEDFRFVSADGREYRQQFLINPTSYLQTIYEGTEYVAVVSTIIDKGDTPTLVYLPQSSNPLWFDPNTGNTP